MKLSRSAVICGFCFLGVATATACGSNSGSSKESAPDAGNPDATSPPDATASDDADATRPADSTSSFGGDGGGTSMDGGGTTPCEEQCPQGLMCNHGFCEPPQPACMTNADCEDDSYCQAMQCVPYGAGPDAATNDPTCNVVPPPGVFAPRVFCSFSAPPAGDPFPNHVDVQVTPMVVNFNQGPTSEPSIIANFTAPVANSYTENLGIIRVLSGVDCSLQKNLGGVDIDGDGLVDWTQSSSPVAVGDLDGDGVAEIVAYMADGSMIAFTLKNGLWDPLWPHVKATLADGTTIFKSAIPAGWAGPSIHDIDNDGVPEIIREAYVIEGPSGMLRASPPANYATYSQGIHAVAADINADNNVELLNGAHIWTFDGPNNTWDTYMPYEAASSGSGWTAMADFTPYTGLHVPEIAVASSDTLSVYNLDHSPFMGMNVIPVPGLGGGPPTIADFDGDGLPEVGLAGKDYYTVFDPDCQATPRTGGLCADRTHCDSSPGGMCPDLILWSRHSQDHSSDITGSSVFDFDGSGHAKVVYADECFVRVFDGQTGNALFSQYHSSCTWTENPIVADVDGDFRAELVVPHNTACGPIGIGIACAGSMDMVPVEDGGTVGVDSYFPGLICLQNSDCASNVCDNGLCRCTTSAQCCAAASDAACLEEGLACAAPPTGTPGTGNTCRAAKPHGVQGITVYKDAADRWVRSRPIWNQDAYAVTNVNDDGTIPKTSAWATNWTTAGLNNFRQNVPGSNAQSIGDLTAQAGSSFICSSTGVTLNAPICNRGTAPVGSGIIVGFYVGSMNVCSTATIAALPVGQCETVSCTWATPPTSASGATNVTVVANDGNAIAECDSKNDDGLVENVYCSVSQ